MNQDFVQVPCPSCGTIVWVSPGVGFAKCPSCQTTTHLASKQNAAFAQTMPAQPSLMAEILKSDPRPALQQKIELEPSPAAAKPSSSRVVLLVIAAAVVLAVVGLVAWLAMRPAAHDARSPLPASSSP